MVTNLMILVLALMIIGHKYYTDKEIAKLKWQLNKEAKINSELIKATKELLSLHSLIVNHMIKPLSTAVNEIANSIEPPEDSEE